MTKRLAPLMVFATLLIGLPILGASLTGQPMSRYFEFPLGGRYVQHAPFSWAAFALFGTLGLLAGVGLVLLYFPRRKESCSIAARYPFPWWGWLSGAVLVSFWALAWRRFAWLEPLQSLTFTPLWIAYVVFVNALTYWRTGNCLLTRRTQYLLALFPASALFWWCFEYLNSFAQNWYYVGQELFTPLSYTVLSTAAYSTVLPAVMSTVDLLQSFSRLRHPRFQRPFVLGNRKACAGVVLGLCLVRTCRDCGLARLLLSLALGLATVHSRIPAGATQRREPCGETGARALACGHSTCAGGFAVRFFLGDVEPLQLPKVGVLYPLRAAIQDLRDAHARVSRLFAVRAGMLCDSGPGGTLFENSWDLSPIFRGSGDPPSKAVPEFGLNWTRESSG